MKSKILSFPSQEQSIKTNLLNWGEDAVKRQKTKDVWVDYKGILDRLWKQFPEEILDALIGSKSKH